MNVAADHQKIHAEVTLDITLQRVWNLLTEPDHLVNWWGDHVSIEPKLNGTFCEVWFDGERKVTTSGKVTTWNPPEKLALTWADDDWQVETTVSFALMQTGEETLLIFKHSGWDQFPLHLQDKLINAHKDGWSTYLKQLEKYAQASQT